MTMATVYLIAVFILCMGMFCWQLSRPRTLPTAALRRFFREVDHKIAKVATRSFADSIAPRPFIHAYDKTAREARISLLNDAEYQASVTLFLVDPHLAIELAPTLSKLSA